MADLRERRRRATGADLVSAALVLFTERGFDATTMEDVADAAGVSRRTLYRYFPRKDDLVFAAPAGWLGEWDAVIADRRPQEPLYAVMRRGARAVAQQIAADPEPVLTSSRISRTTPSLQPRLEASNREWRERIAALVGAEIGADPATDARCTVTAGAIMGAIDGMLKAWTASAGKRDPVKMTDDVMRRLEPAWPTLIEA
ncbi:MAG: TetR family transcriptional regulator [Solirubrobacterales bacterium]|nr:TetR family transcriptional regulator [Solirubrobacterales bacterium]